MRWRNILFLLCVSFCLSAQDVGLDLNQQEQNLWSLVESSLQKSKQETNSVMNYVSKLIADLRLSNSISEKQEADYNSLRLHYENTEVSYKQLQTDYQKLKMSEQMEKQAKEAEQKKNRSIIGRLVAVSSALAFIVLVKFAVRIMKKIPQTAVFIKLIPDSIIRWID